MWVDNRGVPENADGDNYYDMYMYDLSTKKETQITTSGDAIHPAIYEDKIAWLRGHDGYC